MNTLLRCRTIGIDGDNIFADNVCLTVTAKSGWSTTYHFKIQLVGYDEKFSETATGDYMLMIALYDLYTFDDAVNFISRTKKKNIYNNG